MKESLPPVHLAPILEGNTTEEFNYLREKARSMDIRTIVSLRGGGALLPRILGFMPQLFDKRVLGAEPWGMVGTSTGAIAGFFARDIGFAHVERWHHSMQPVADFKGWRAPWSELTVNGLPQKRPRKLNFGQYYEQKILPRIDQLEPQENKNDHVKPSLNMVVVARREDRQPYVYHDEHWTDEEGQFDRQKMIQCVEGSCCLPFFVPTHDEHIGQVIDGGLSRPDMTAPIEVAGEILGKQGVILSVEPVGNLKRGIHIENREGLQVVRVVMEQQITPFQQARNILVFDPKAYEIGAKWGRYAAEVIQQISE